MMTQLKIIQDETEHQQALARLAELMEQDPPADSAESAEINVLAVLIEDFETKHFPIDPPDPIDAIEFRVDQMGLSRKDLVPYIGSQSKVSEVLNHKRPLSLNMIRRLSEGLGISADVLIREPTPALAGGADIDWQAFPLSEMRKRGYFPDFHGSVQELREYAAEQVGAFIGRITGGFELQPTLLRSSVHLRTNDKVMDDYAFYAWRIRVLEKAQAEPLAVHYQAGTVDLAFMHQLASLSWSTSGPLTAREYLARYGIHLVTEPHLPKTYLDGAVCRDADGNPVIALTLRHDRLDLFWFTLMHELAHVARHLDGGTDWFVDDLDAEANEQLEHEADDWAGEALIPSTIWQTRRPRDTADVEALARELNLAPEIIAGRLRHETDDYRLFGKRFRTRVKSLFVQQGLFPA